jgi:hypothetical protein
MGQAEQQAWLRRLEERAARAARIALKPEEAAKETAQVRGLLHRKLITWKVLREAIEKTDAREQDAIGQLHQRYRDQVFETFYKQMDEYGRRQEAWNAVLRSWQAAGGPFEQQERLIDWLEAAIRSASPETVGAVPERPDFGGGSGVEAAKPQAEKKTEEPAKPQAEEGAKPQAEKIVRVVRKPEIEEDEDQSAAGPVEVNVEELGARIAGFNMALRALEADLDESGTWDAARLSPMVERLKILAFQRGDLDLFREAVSAEKQSGVARLESPKAVISQLGARIFAARNYTFSPKFTGTEADRRAETGRLETLSRRLAEVEGK